LTDIWRKVPQTLSFFFDTEAGNVPASFLRYEKSVLPLLSYQLILFRLCWWH